MVMNEQQRKKLDTFFVRTFNNLLSLEEIALNKSGINNLSVREVHVIAAVIHLEQSGSNTMSQIANSLNISVGALTTAVNTLIRKGYLKRAATEVDRRIVLVSATASGYTANDKHERFHRLMIDQVAALIDEEDLARLTVSLEQLSAFFESYANKI